MHTLFYIICLLVIIGLIIHWNKFSSTEPFTDIRNAQPILTNNNGTTNNIKDNENNHKPNGRVILQPQPPDISSLFSIYDKIPANQCATYRNATEGQWENTPLSMAFFSAKNMEIIQNNIRQGVYYKSKKQYVIGQQDCDALKIIMRSIFLQHSTNNPTDIPTQIQALNKLVVEYCVTQVYSEAQGYSKYLQDVSSLPVPISNPIMSSQRDRNDYETGTKWF